MNVILVCFEDRQSKGLLAALRRGFRHCRLCLRIERRWVVLDPLNGELSVGLERNVEKITLAAGFAAAGAGVLLIRQEPAPPVPKLELRPLTCVEVVKRLVCLRAPLVLTPWQLYRRLACRAGLDDERI